MMWYKDMCVAGITDNNSTDTPKWRWNEINLIGVVLPYHLLVKPELLSKDMAFIMSREILKGHIHTMISSGSKGICIGGAGLGEAVLQREQAIVEVKQIMKEVTTELGVSTPVLLMIQGMNSLSEVEDVCVLYVYMCLYMCVYI